MNLRRWLLVGGASILGAVALMAPAGSQAAFSNNARYEGEINNDPDGSNVQVTRVGNTCVVNTLQTVGVRDTGNSGQKAFGASTINYTVTVVGGTSDGTTIASGQLPVYGDAPIGGSSIPCDATGVSVLFDPVCTNEPNNNCQNDTVTGGVNITYLP